MFRILFFVVATLVAVSVAKFGPECMKHAHTFKKCCKSTPDLKLDGEAFAECAKLKKPPPPPPCDVDICMAKHHGFASSEDGKFDKSKLTEHIQSQLKDEPELAMDVIDNCVNGDLSGYGPPDFCDLVKLRHCFMAHVGKACKDWDSSAECQTTKEAIKECVN